MALRLVTVGIRPLAYPGNARTNVSTNTLRGDGDFDGVEFLADAMALSA